MKISVVIPAYNRAGLVGETLERVLAQTLAADEVVVVDDGSRDGTASVVAGFGERVRLIRIENSGDMVARNVGLRAASGDVVAFCDSDDLWEADHLASMAGFWEGGDGPVAAYADFREVRDGVWQGETKFSTAPAGYWDELRPAGGGRFWFERAIVHDLLRFQPYFPSCMVVDRARFLALGGWDEGVSRMVGCDFATTLLVAEHPPVGVLRRATVGVRKHAGNFSADVRRMNLGDADVLCHVLAQRPSLAAYEDAVRRSVEVRRRAAFDDAFAAGDFGAVRAIGGLLPAGGRSRAARMKLLVAALPAPLRGVAWRGLTAMGTRRAGL